MAVSLRSGLGVSGSYSYYETGLDNKRSLVAAPLDLVSHKNKFKGALVAVREQGSLSHPSVQLKTKLPQICAPHALIWWKKNSKPNMVEIRSAQELVDFLSTAGDTLIVVDFYSPGCGGCRALHPKICQMAEFHPDAKFLKVNYEEHKAMCHSLHIHVLPFFRFYRGAHGRLCSFSCTNATIKKFEDAMVKHSTERCSAGPAKGLEVSELMSLASKGLIKNDDALSSSSMAGVRDTALTGI